MGGYRCSTCAPCARPRRWRRSLRSCRARLRASWRRSRSILATTGIYGVVAYRTAFRTHEIGIRIALGASPGDVQRLVLLQGLSLTAIGLSLGLALSFSAHALHCRVSLWGGSQRSSDGHRGSGIACGDVAPRMLLSGATRDARRSRSCHARVVNESDFAPRLSASHREGRALQRSRR